MCFKTRSQKRCWEVVFLLITDEIAQCIERQELTSALERARGESLAMMGKRGSASESSDCMFYIALLVRLMF